MYIFLLTICFCKFNFQALPGTLKSSRKTVSSPILGKLKQQKLRKYHKHMDILFSIYRFDSSSFVWKSLEVPMCDVCELWYMGFLDFIVTILKSLSGWDALCLASTLSKDCNVPSREPWRQTLNIICGGSFSKTLDYWLYFPSVIHS